MSEKNGIMILDGTVESISTRKDRTIKIVFGTQEMREVSNIFGLQNNLVTIGISTNGLDDSEVELLKSSRFDLDAVPNGKSPSQRLRAVLYRIWENSETGYDDFNLYYLNKIETVIDHYKQRLDELTG